METAMTQEPQYREQSCPLETVEESPQRGAVSASREQDSGQRDRKKVFFLNSSMARLACQPCRELENHSTTKQTEKASS